MEEKLLWFLIGVTGLLLIMKVIPSVVVKIFPGQVGTFINGFMVPFYILGAFPWCMERLRTD